MEAFTGIEAFARVVETGSFTAAAQALQSAKSSVSETVRALEERMGVRLLDRTTRRVRPTEAGTAFYRHCRRLLDDLALARSEAQATQKEPAGRLRIAAPDGFADHEAGILRSNPLIPQPGKWQAKAESYRARWPWLRIAEEGA